MKALTYQGAKTVEVLDVPDPKIMDPKDVIVKITLTAICGSDLHLYGGLVPTLKKGDILGHEFMGIVEEVGSEVKKIKKGDRVVVPFTIACGHCFFCEHQMYSLCDETNPNAEVAAAELGYSPAGLFGFSHMFGGFAGGQAQYARVPYADVGLQVIPENMTDEQVLFLSDIFPTGYMAAENCNIQPGDTVAVWGAGPVGQFAIRSAFLLGAKRVISIDRVPERLEMAKQAGAEIINYEDEKEVFEIIKDKTGGRGPDSAIDAVGMEAHGNGGINSIMNIVDKAKQAVRIETDRGTAIRQAIHTVRKGGTVSVPGVYAGFMDTFPVGILMNKALTIRSGQTHVQKYTEPLLKMIEDKKIDPSFVITHKLKLEEAPKAYEIFRDKKDNCIKVVLDPFA